jgi:hypothetical protein
MNGAIRIDSLLAKKGGAYFYAPPLQSDARRSSTPDSIPPQEPPDADRPFLVSASSNFACGRAAVLRRFLN